jgi:hypothetical protein
MMIFQLLWTLGLNLSCDLFVVIRIHNYGDLGVAIICSAHID